MRSSWLPAVVVVLVLCAWMASGLLSPDTESSPANTRAYEPMLVEVQVLPVESMNRTISLQGQLEPARHLILSAETSGTVKQIPVVKGTRVKRGDPLVILDAGDRQSSLAEAKARVKSASSEQLAAQSLRQRGLQSQLQLEKAEAALEAALAQQAAIELDISNTTVKAPFDAIVNDVPVEIGMLVERGDSVAELVDDSYFRASAQASQKLLSSLQLGRHLNVELITGQSVPGKLTYISSLADSQTRSFNVEARIDNPDGTLAAGVSASLHIPVEQVEATFISPSALSLGADGEIGVKAVNSEQRVVFLPVNIVSTSLDGAWVTGIPVSTQVITLGQGFVNTGELVVPKQIDAPVSKELAGSLNANGQP